MTWVLEPNRETSDFILYYKLTFPLVNLHTAMNIAGPHLDAELFAGHGRKKLSMNLTTHAFQPEVQTTKQKSRSRDSNPQAQNTEAVMLTIRLPCCCRFDYVTETNNCFILTTGAIPIKPATSRSKSQDHKSTNYTFMDCRPNIRFGGGRLYNLVKGGFWCGVCMFKPHACSLGSVVCWGFPMGIAFILPLIVLTT